MLQRSSIAHLLPFRHIKPPPPDAHLTRPTPASYGARAHRLGGQDKMSLKGITKSIQRTPQQFKQRFNIGDNTKDAVYMDAERRFAELEKETKKLHDESKKYFDAINGQ